MALFNVTSARAIPPDPIRDFRTSNMNIHIDTEMLKISQLQITEQQWLGNL